MIAGTLLPGLSAKAVITLTFEQIGNDVAIRGSGKANLSALTLDTSSDTFQNVLTHDQAYAGASPFEAGSVDLYRGTISGPASFSSNTDLTEEPDSLTSSGPIFGIMAFRPRVVLPKGYVSNTEISGISVIKNVSISSLGLTPGSFEWTWGDAGTGTFDPINLIIPANEGVPGPLPIAGAAVMLGWCRKMRRLTRPVNKK